MRYGLYLRQSLLRRAGRHGVMAVILVCVLVLPFMTCIMRDSMMYGKQQQELDRLKGAAYYIEYVKEEYLGVFSNLPGLRAWFEDGYIYLKALSEAELADPELVKRYSDQLQALMDGIGDSRLRLVNCVGGVRDTSLAKTQNEWLVIVIGMILATLPALAVSYSEHVRGFSSDIGDLRAMGASQKQVSALFLMEAVILLLGAAIVAGAVAMALMKALFVWFFELKEMQSLSWVIFHVNFWKLLAIAAAYLCAMAAILLLTLRGLCRAPIVQLMREDAEGNRVRRPRRRLRAGRSAVASVRRMLLSRANGRYVSCLLLSVPVAVAVFVAANTVLSSISVVNPRPEYELRVTQMRENEQGGWFTEEDRSAILALPGVRDVELSSVVTARTYENGEWRNDDGDGSTINRIYVYLSDISRHEAVEKWLRDTYAGQEYSVVNEYAEYERTEVAFVGLLWLLLVFLLVLLVLEAMVVSARLTGFVLAQRGNLRKLYGLGASAGTLIRAYSGQAERAAAWGMILTIVPSAALLWVLNKSEMYFLDLRPGVLAMNLGCAALLALSYILPVRLALKKAMRGIRAEER